MSILTAALYDVLAGDSVLVGMLAQYKELPAVFTQQPVPGDAEPPYLVSAGEVVQLPWDTKTTRGRELVRDVKAYTNADGNVVLVEAIIERARALLHRREIAAQGFRWVISNVMGPVAADESGYYSRVLSLSLKAQEE